MSSRNDTPTFGARINETVQNVSDTAADHREWLDRLEARLESTEEEIKSRIRELRERHRKARQSISNELQALAEELGYLPTPTYSNPALGTWYEEEEGNYGGKLSYAGPTIEDVADKEADDPLFGKSSFN